MAITDVSPTVACGRFPAKRIVGDVLEVTATVCVDGHDSLAAKVLYRHQRGPWQSTPMALRPDGRYAAWVPLTTVGITDFAVEAWVDRVATWEGRIARKRAAGLDTTLDEQAAAAAEEAGGTSNRVRCTTRHVVVDRGLGQTSAWYELFPRSTVRRDAGDGAQAEHGTFADVRDRLPAIAAMGFDIVYLPPIHPIGHSHRKGPDNALLASPDDVGSPWAIGDESGGHTAIHEQLGTLEDLRALVEAAQGTGDGLEIALDLAFQCSPDHPWVHAHPEWFTTRPDGSIAHAENPPKSYEDIVPFDFECEDWPGLWEALADVVRHWRRVGIRVFRVDNPHTKPFAFWEWLITEMKREDPGLVFLAEAFATPAVMTQLARVGFTQSYTHFPWQHTPAQLRDYFTRLTTGETVEHLRGSAWPNTPDILTEELQQGVRAAYVSRLVLAATLSASYGIYGPPFQLMESRPRPGAEEYAANEKYQLRTWPGDDLGLAPLITTVNAARHRLRALQHDRTLRFHHCDNDRLVAYSKTAPSRVDPPRQGQSDDPVLVVASTDHWNTHVATVTLDLEAVGLAAWDRYAVEDVLTGDTYTWQGARNVVVLGPDRPAHVFRIVREGTR